ncbi:RNA polymerase sigma factor [Candidatus Poriferisodalis sp.]|uniref:RNA polymerase sigma factor n=1 Tax=Candidatus Poriferisodalis sp. TaxID=3101277 RepID=UPI003B51E097
MTGAMAFPLFLRVTAMALRLEDRDLVIAYQAGDNDAFAELVREYRPQLVGHARRRLNCDESAEDAVQETLVRALRAMPRFNGNYMVGPWLHRILTNVCIDEGNRRRRESEKTERVAKTDTTVGPSPSAEVELGLDVDHSELSDAVDGLSEPYREALRLRFVEELSYDEMAKAAGVSEDNARARVSRARSALRAALRVAAFVPVALVGLLRRGERAAAAVSSQSPGGGRAALNSAMPMFAETAPVASRAAAAVSNAATTGVPIVAKAALGFGLATAVIAPTVDSPVHRAADRVLPDSVMGVLAPLAMELPTPDAPVVVPAAAPVTGVADLTDPAGAGAAAEVVAVAAAAVVQEEAPQAVERAAPAAAAVVVDSGSGSDRLVADESGDGTVAATQTAAESTGASAVAPSPVVSVMATSSVEGAELTFTPSGADRYDVAGTLSMAVTTTTTTTTGDEETTETLTTNESVAVVSPSTASLDAEDPAVTERSFSALLVFAPGDDGLSAEMRLAARGTMNDDGSLSMTGRFSATPTESLPLVVSGTLSGTLALDSNGMPQSLTVTLTP